MIIIINRLHTRRDGTDGDFKSWIDFTLVGERVVNRLLINNSLRDTFRDTIHPSSVCVRYESSSTVFYTLGPAPLGFMVDSLHDLPSLVFFKLKSDTRVSLFAFSLGTLNLEFFHPYHV